MKTGVIVYVVGEGVKDCEFDEKEAASKLDVKADRVEFVFSGQTAGDLAYSWFHMTVKGMSRIVLHGRGTRRSVRGYSHRTADCS